MRAVEDAAVGVAPPADEERSRIAQLATFGVSGERPPGRSSGRSRARAAPGSRRCSTRSPQTIASKDSGSKGSSIVSTSPTSTSAHTGGRLGRVGVELDPDDACARRDEGRREVAGRAADVEHARPPVHEGHLEQPGVTPVGALVERHVALIGRGRARRSSSARGRWYASSGGQEEGTDDDPHAELVACEPDRRLVFVRALPKPSDAQLPKIATGVTTPASSTSPPPTRTVLEPQAVGDALDEGVCSPRWTRRRHARTRRAARPACRSGSRTCEADRVDLPGAPEHVDRARRE